MMDLNNFMLQLAYRDPFNQEEQDYYQYIRKGIDEQLAMSIKFLRSDDGRRFYEERAEYLEYLWDAYDLSAGLDALMEFNGSSCNGFMDFFYHSGARVGYEQLKRGLCFTRADEETLNFIRGNNLGYVKSLNSDVRDGIRRIIFQDVAEGRSIGTTIGKLRRLPLEPVGDGRVSPDVRARMIARTERARARNYGTLQSYANYGVEWYDVVTAGDARVCNLCVSIEEGNPYRLGDSSGYAPFHVNCRCGYAPHIPEDTVLADTPLDFPVTVAEYVGL